MYIHYFSIKLRGKKSSGWWAVFSGMDGTGMDSRGALLYAFLINVSRLKGGLEAPFFLDLFSGGKRGEGSL